MIRFSCRSCRQHYEADDEMAGQPFGRCACGATITIPRIPPILPTPAISRPVKSSNLQLLSVLLVTALIFLSFAIAFPELLEVFSPSKRPPSPPREVVYNSDWDGSVRQVHGYLMYNLKDPDSYQSIDWGPVKKIENGNFTVSHRYRAKNSFGGYNLSDRVFFLTGTGRVIASIDVANIR